MHIVIIGCGTIGKKVAQRALETGHSFSGLSRSHPSDWLSKNIHRVDLDSAATFPVLEPHDVLYHFAPPPKKGIVDSRTTQLLAGLSATQVIPKRVVLISTTGIYGNCHGDWVDETRPANPQTDRARRRLSAESQWQTFCDQQKIPLLILRVAGIYGPEKLPRARLERGEPVLRNSESPFSNRIHTDDLALLCFTAGQRGKAGIYNATDGNPTTMTDFFYQVADTLNIKRPSEISMKQAEQQLSKGMLSYLAESKRLSNDKILTELKVRLNYPTLQQGLSAINQ